MREERPRANSVLLILLMVGMILSIFAQSGRRPGGTVSTPADDVVVKPRKAPFTIPVSAIDEDSKPVAGLARREFHLFENGVEQEIIGFSSTEEPFQIALLIDTSRSTLTKMKAMQQAAFDFVEQLRPQDRVMVLSFDDDIYIDTEMTDNRDVWRRAISGTRVGRGARIFDAIDLTITERLGRLEGRKAIVLLTDGVDSGSQHSTAHSTITRAEATGVIVYPIQYLSRLAPRTVLNSDLRGREGGDPARYFYFEIAERSGAKFHRADTLIDLSLVFREVAEDLRHQYWLSYNPADATDSGKVRRIRVSVERPGVFARARRGP